MSNEVIDAKQKLLLEYLLSDRTAFVKCYRILRKEYFSPPLDRVVEFVMKYFSDHHNIPKLAVIEAETGISFKKVELDPHDIDYLLEEVEALCQDAAMELAIIQGVELLEEGKRAEIPDLVRKALLVKLDSSIGTNVFEDPEKRIESMNVDMDERSCGIHEIDEMIGNTRRGELGVVYAVSSGGKSVFLANLARNYAEQKLDVCVISLELNELLYSKRLDTILTGKDIRYHAQLKAEISDSLSVMKVDYGNIIVKKMRFGTTVEEIRAYIMEYQLEMGKAPDVLIVDYLGIMGVGGTNLRFMNNKFDMDEAKAFGLRDLAVDYNMYTFTAGQINREGQDVMEVDASHVSGGISVINACDWALALVANQEDQENNQVHVKKLKLRNSSSVKPFILYRDPRTLQFSSKPMNTKLTTHSTNSKITSSDLKNLNGRDKLKKALKK